MLRWQAILFILVGAASYGLLATFIKIGYSKGLTVGQINGSQQLVGAVLLWAFAAIKLKRFKKPPFKTVIKLMTVGTLSGMTSLLYYASMQTVPASIAIILLFQFVWVGVLYESGYLIAKSLLSKYILHSC